MRWLIASIMLLIAHAASGQERRAPAPRFSPDQIRSIFFESLEDAFQGPRPPLASLRQKRPSQPASTKTAVTPNQSGPAWEQLIEPESLEDAVKQAKLHFDSVVTTPSAFNSGGFQEARVDLSVLATLFAVIRAHPADIRWKSDAAAARDLLSRTAYNCKAGSTQVYNEAKSRRDDLQDLISGGGIANPDGNTANDWSQIADRSPLMEYAEKLINTLESATNDQQTIAGNIDSVRRNGQLLAMLGEVLVQPGMADADDGDYAQLSRSMTREAVSLVAATESGDAAAVQAAVGAIRQRCDACHEQYR